ncbi:MAG: hypothetical protein E7491_08545 [Ruminococcaceae bacterium]|nr:hypothetical protein [Oscillospiraceae bacterium]
MKTFNKRFFKYGGFAAAMTAIFIAVILLLNVVFTWAVRNYSFKIDLTDEGFYRLDQKTVDYIKGLDLDEPVKIMTAMPKSDYDRYTTSYLIKVKELLYNYVNDSNGNIVLEYHDVYTEPDFVEKYGTDGQLDENAIIVASEKRFTILTVTDFFKWAFTTNTSSATGYTPVVKGFVGEATINTALTYVTRDVLPTALFTSGHNEAESAEVKRIFEANNYVNESINLLQSDLSQDTMVLIIAAPKADFTDAEIEKIDAYLDNGGNMMVFLSPEYTLKNLESYLEKWGVAVTHHKLYDASSSLANDPNALILRYGNTAFTSGLSASSTTFVAPNAYALETLWAQKDARTVSLALKSSGSAYFNGEGSTQEEFEDGIDTKSQFIVGTLTEKTRYVNNLPIETKVFISSSSDMIADEYISAGNYANSKLITNAIAIFGDGIENTFVVEDKAMGDDTLNIDSDAYSIYAIIFTVIVPVLCFALGIVVYMRRRHL